MEIKYDLSLVKRYLGMDENPNEIDQDIEELYQKLLPLVKPRYYYQVFDFKKNPVTIKNRVFNSNDIDKLLESSEKVIILAVTLGVTIEQQLRKYSISNKLYSVISDALLSSMVEDYQESVIDEIKQDYPSKHFTDAFAPGYGDMDIKYQRDIFDLLQLEKRVGINLTDTMLMIPRKSITCIIGISDIKQKKMIGCETCNMKETCLIRKAGKTCAK